MDKRKSRRSAQTRRDKEENVLVGKSALSSGKQNERNWKAISQMVEAVACL
jgi:hypothetical protein